MKVKLDENLGRRGAEVLRDAGCDVATVAAQQLCSVSDVTLMEVCRIEERVLVSLDRDFANTLLYRPSRYHGIVVLRLPEPLRLDGIEAALRPASISSRMSAMEGPNMLPSYPRSVPVDASGFPWSSGRWFLPESRGAARR